MAKIAQLILFSLLIGTASIAAEPKSLAGSFTKTAGEAVAEGFTIDLPLNLLFWGLGMASPQAVAVKTVAAATSYMVRKTCNDYNEDENGKRDWRISTVCGFVGGALKYSSRSAILGNFNIFEPLVGALDAGLYEATSQIRGNHQTAEIAGIEAIVSTAQYFQNLRLKPDQAFSISALAAAAKEGAAVGALVSGTVYTTLTWYGADIKNWVDTQLGASKKDEL